MDAGSKGWIRAEHLTIRFEQAQEARILDIYSEKTNVQASERRMHQNIKCL